jgi:hypothetical protein
MKLKNITKPIMEAVGKKNYIKTPHIILQQQQQNKILSSDSLLLTIRFLVDQKFQNKIEIKNYAAIPA